MDPGPEPWFACDAMLGGLARWLRAAGYDASWEHGIDDRHEELAVRWLGKHFPEDVTEPIRLHVAAKRFLCATDGGYLARLSPASRLIASRQ